MVALSALTLPPLHALFTAGVLAACAAYAITVVLARFAHRLGGVEGKWLHGSVIVFVVAVSLLLTGPFGGLVLLLATLAGLVPYLVNVPRMYCMGSVMIPVMLYSFGIGWF
jgi:putative membrane protein